MVTVLAVFGDTSQLAMSISKILIETKRDAIKPDALDVFMVCPRKLEKFRMKMKYLCMHKLIVTSQHAGYRVITREATRNTHAWRRFAVENARRFG